MLNTVIHPSHALSAEDRDKADPRAVALIESLAGCCHPRVARLKARLAACPDSDELAALKGEVLNLLTLSFGAAEARQRVQGQLQ